MNKFVKGMCVHVDSGGGWRISSSLALVLLLLALPTEWQLCKAVSDADVAYVPRLSEAPLQLFLDVDNTLYREKELSKGIEAQIVRGIKEFCHEECQLSGSQADALFHKFGSTEEGLRRTLWKNATTTGLRNFLQNYYETCYAKVDVAGLLPGGPGLGAATGYSHAMAQRRLVRQALEASPSHLVLASNSPAFHVRKVVQALGLCRVFAEKRDLLTPDHPRPFDKKSSKEVVFPTKMSPLAYFGPQNLSRDQMVLLDDSSTNLQSVDRLMRTYRVDEHQSLSEALARTWGWLDEDYVFSSVDYLRCKNVVDEQSLHRVTWNTMLDGVVTELSQRSEAAPLTIVDVGAGMLSMHRLLLRQNSAEDLPSIWTTLQTKQLSKKVSQIHYIAYEPNQELKQSCVDYLLESGYSAEEELVWDTGDGQHHVRELIFTIQTSDQLKVKVSLRFWDYREQVKTNVSPSPDLIVGCCFSDLIAPDELVRSVLRCFMTKPESFQSSALLYFPITFWGVTQLLPSSPAATIEKQTTPSDTQAFQLYGKVLDEEFGHHLQPSKLVEAVQDHGGDLLAQGPSDWKIDPQKHGYLWRTMMYFFATAVAPSLQASGFDAAQWIRRAWTLRPSIRASNVDLLLKLPFIGRWETQQEETEILAKSRRAHFSEIQFTAPGEVAFIQKKRPALEHDQIRIQSLCSLVSSGTELKIFNGSFDDAALDVNIKSMEGERMGFPLAYGYCLVGRVTECGEGVDDDMYGKVVFTFAAHASEVVTKASSVQLVPEGIDPLDAIFMPSVETALSIVHDAHPRLGEKIVVYGQGLIGLLVTSLLSLSSLNLQVPCLTTVDTFPERLALSSLLGSQQAVLPTEVAACEAFDLAIEASGNYRALQSAIDCTRNGGRIIIASWYGNEDVSLKLGIDFHRSHKTIRTSQVSDLPAELRQTWTKQRRFDLVWEVLRDMRPSRLLTKKAAPSDAKEVYEELSRGEQVSVAFDYTIMDS
jgi:threonine dehydrogenase-like Zn-dependent dehydrogenase